MAQPIPNETNYILETKNLDIFYGDFKAVTDVEMKIKRNKITAIIGPSLGHPVAANPHYYALSIA